MFGIIKLMNIKNKLSDSEAAKIFVKENKDFLIKKFADLSFFPPVSNPFSIFMAGSPGAGKTELSKILVKLFARKKPPINIVRIDADEIKKILPQYKGYNSDAVQGASALGVEKLFDWVLKKGQNVIVDGTFSDFEKSKNNIERCLRRRREVGILYLYQNPVIAWTFTKKREKMEGRYIPKEAFVESFFAAKDNVNKIKAIFKDEVKIHLIEKNYDNNLERTRLNIDNIDHHLKLRYTHKSLELALKEL